MVPGMPQVLSIAIAGAGIGGLTAAALLAQDGHRVTVFDQFTQPQPVGSGLVIQPVGQAVLRLIGAEAAAQGLGRRLHRMAGTEADSGRTVLDVRYDRNGGPRHGLAIHRAALFASVHAAALQAGASIVPATRVSATRPCRDRREVSGADGAALGRYDLVVDAAGAGSALSPLKARLLHYGAVWGTVPWPATDLRQDELRQRYRRASKMVGVLPLGRMAADGPEVAALFWSLPRPALDHWPQADIAGWKTEVTALWPEVAPFLASIRTPADMTPARYSHGTLHRPHASHLVHIGDAAHRASPQLGQGANMALLDALALALAVRGEGADPGPLYARLRRWHVRLYQVMSAVFTPQYQSDSRMLPVLRDRLLMPLSQTWPLPRVLTRLVGGDLILPLAGVDFPPRPVHPAALAPAKDRP